MVSSAKSSDPPLSKEKFLLEHGLSDDHWEDETYGDHEHDENDDDESDEICRASFVLDVTGEDANGSVKRAVERKLDTCGSVSIALFLPTCRISKTAGSVDSRKLFSLV